MSTDAKKQFGLFIIAGLLGLAVDTGVLYAVAQVVGFYAGRVVSFLAAVATTWFFNRSLTFKAAAQANRVSLWREFGHYLLTMGFGGMVNYAAYAATLHWVHLPGSALLGVAMGSLAGMSFNFLSARYLVFKAHRQKPL